MKVTNALTVVGIVVGCIGAAGQTWLLHHELADSYPYKVMSSPPADFYFEIAATGSYLAPVIALAVTLLAVFALRREWTAWILPVFTCPLIFALVFLIRDAAWNGPVRRNFDGTTQQQVATGFLIYAFELAIVGSLSALVAWFSVRFIRQSSFLR